MLLLLSKTLIKTTFYFKSQSASGDADTEILNVSSQKAFFCLQSVLFFAATAATYSPCWSFAAQAPLPGTPGPAAYAATTADLVRTICGRLFHSAYYYSLYPPLTLPNIVLWCCTPKLSLFFSPHPISLCELR